MAYTTESSYTGNGTLKDFLVTFPFLESTDIKARVNGVDTSAFTITGNTVTFTTAPPNTQAVLLYRDTDIDKTKVVFHAGASIRAQDLNNTSKQLLYAIQEEEQNTGGVAFAVGNKGQISVNTANSWVINNDVISNAMMTVNSIDSDQYVDGSIDLAHMSSESVDEDNLKISNAGSNGQYLQKQSGDTGGLTWATVTPYTHPNHTGEVTSTSDGATVIVDDVVDTDNLKTDNGGNAGDFLKRVYSGGGLTWDHIEPGKVITFATANTTSSVTGSEDTWVDTGLTLNITPKSTSSTIIVTCYIVMFGKPKEDSAGSHSGKYRLRLRVNASDVTEANVGEEMLGTFGQTTNSSYGHYYAEDEGTYMFHEEYGNSSVTQKTFHLECEEQDLSVIEICKNTGRSFINAMEVV